jgi:hypothetical protein
MKNYILKYRAQLLTNCLIVLWIYTSGSKMVAFGEFQRQLALQPFGERINSSLIFVLPGIEIVTAILLALEKTRSLGLMISAFLLCAFTIYVLLVINGYFSKMPCSCGGVLEFLNWKAHMVFNLVFLIMNLLALYFTRTMKGGLGTEA